LVAKLVQRKVHHLLIQVHGITGIPDETALEAGPLKVLAMSGCQSDTWSPLDMVLEHLLEVHLFPGIARGF
jgi:hypothetical protein